MQMLSCKPTQKYATDLSYKLIKNTMMTRRPGSYQRDQGVWIKAGKSHCWGLKTQFPWQKTPMRLSLPLTHPWCMWLLGWKQKMHPHISNWGRWTLHVLPVAWRMYRASIKSKDKDKCCFNILIFIWLQGECQNCVIRRAGFNVIIIIATHALILRAGPDRSLKPCDLHPVASHPVKRNASYFIPKQPAPLFAHPGVSEEIQLGGSQ